MVPSFPVPRFQSPLTVGSRRGYDIRRECDWHWSFPGGVEGVPSRACAVQLQRHVPSARAWWKAVSNQRQFDELQALLPVSNDMTYVPFLLRPLSTVTRRPATITIKALQLSIQKLCSALFRSYWRRQVFSICVNSLPLIEKCGLSVASKTEEHLFLLLLIYWLYTVSQKTATFF